MDSTYDVAALMRPRCKVCSSGIRQGVDLRLMGKEVDPETDERLSYEEIIGWAAAQGLIISKASLSRHKTDHLMPDVLYAVEAQRQVEAIAQATGQTLGMESAFLNMLVNKSMRALENVELDTKGEWLNTSVRAIEALLKVRKAELHFSKEKLEEAKGKMRSGGLSEDAIREIEESVLGLKR